MQLYCPCCRDTSAGVKISLADGDTFTCDECGEDFTLADVRAMIDGAKQWRELLPWVEACPAREEQVAAKS